VSVIVPAFDAAANIRQTLNSVLAQTYQEIEVIVVDDGSSDATSAIAEEFGARDPRFHLIRQSNAGVGAARNTAIRKAGGKYIAPLDADDLWVPEKLEKQVACMEQRGNEAGLVYCWSRLFDKHGIFLRNLDPLAEGRLRQTMVFSNIVGNASVPLFRATALEKVGLYLTRADQGGAQGCEDWDLHLRIAEAFSVYVVPEFLVGYRQTNSSMSAQTEGMAASFTVVLRRSRQRNGDLSPAIFRRSAGNFYLCLAWTSYHWGHYKWCLRHLKEAIRANPVLLRKKVPYRILLKSLLKAAMDSSSNHLAEQVATVAEKVPTRI
jgi:glycosyltransferase involved in cell wall biosynthesis